MGGETKSTTESKPPAWAAPLFSESADEAQKIYASGAGGNPYTGETVAPLSGTTEAGLNQLISAGANTGTSASRPLFQGLGTNAGQVYDAALQPSSAQSNLSSFANGSYLDPSNDPYFSQALGNALNKTAETVQSQFSGAGRLGSGADTNALGTTLGNLAVNAASNQYNQNVQNMLGANQQIDAARNANEATQLGALGAGQTAANSIAGLDQNQFNNNITGANTSLQAGNIFDTQQQKLLNEAQQKFVAQDNAPWTRLGLLQSAAQGSAGNYGISTATQSNPLNPLSVLGAAGSLATKM